MRQPSWTHTHIHTHTGLFVCDGRRLYVWSDKSDPGLPGVAVIQLTLRDVMSRVV